MKENLNRASESGIADPQESRGAQTEVIGLRFYIATRLNAE
jgi:hypothetical protein